MEQQPTTIRRRLLHPNRRTTEYLIRFRSISNSLKILQNPQRQFWPRKSNYQKLLKTTLKHGPKRKIQTIFRRRNRKTEPFRPRVYKITAFIWQIISAPIWIYSLTDQIFEQKLLRHLNMERIGSNLRKIAILR